MGEYNICHAREILIEQRSEDAGFQRLHKLGETGDVGKKGCNLAALSAELDGISIAGELLCPDLVKSSVTARHRLVRLPPDADARPAIIRCAGWSW